jgi:hypothetical protein
MMKVGDLVKYLGTVAYGRGIGIVVEMEPAIAAGGTHPTIRVRILAPSASKSGYVVQLQHNLEVINESR